MRLGGPGHGSAVLEPKGDGNFRRANGPGEDSARIVFEGGTRNSRFLDGKVSARIGVFVVYLSRRMERPGGTHRKRPPAHCQHRTPRQEFAALCRGGRN